MFVVLAAMMVVVLVPVAVMLVNIAVTLMVRRNDAARGRDQEPGDHTTLNELNQSFHRNSPCRLAALML
jgi:hypothetical protein